MNFRVVEKALNKLLEACNKIWNKVNNIKNEFDTKPVYN